MKPFLSQDSVIWESRIHTKLYLRLCNWSKSPLSYPLQITTPTIIKTIEHTDEAALLGSAKRHERIGEKVPKRPEVNGLQFNNNPTTGSVRRKNKPSRKRRTRSTHTKKTVQRAPRWTQPTQSQMREPDSRCHPHLIEKTQEEGIIGKIAESKLLEEWNHKKQLRREIARINCQQTAMTKRSCTPLDKL